MQPVCVRVCTRACVSVRKRPRRGMVGMFHPERNERADKHRTFGMWCRGSVQPGYGPGSVLSAAPPAIKYDNVGVAA